MDLRWLLRRVDFVWTDDDSLDYRSPSLFAFCAGSITHATVANEQVLARESSLANSADKWTLSSMRPLMSRKVLATFERDLAVSTDKLLSWPARVRVQSSAELEDSLHGGEGRRSDRGRSR